MIPHRRPSTLILALRALPAALVLMAGPASAQQIPAGTSVVIRTVDAIDSDDADLARQYRAALDEDLVVNGSVLAPRGAEALLRIAEVEQAGAVSGRDALTLQLASVAIDGQYVPVSSGEVTSESGSQRNRAVRTGVAGAAIGGVVGGLLGGGGGAVRGAAIGGGGGVAVAALQGQRVQVPAETRLTFTIANAPPPPPAAPQQAFAPAPAAPPAPAATTQQTFNQIQFSITEAVGQGTTLRVTLTAFNQGVDRELVLGRNYIGGAGAVSMIDNFGNSYPVSSVVIGNQPNESPIINGIPTTVVLTFEKMNTIGGEMQATSIGRLLLAPVLNGDTRNAGRLEFRNVPIQK